MLGGVPDEGVLLPRAKPELLGAVLLGAELRGVELLGVAEREGAVLEPALREGLGVAIRLGLGAGAAERLGAGVDERLGAGVAERLGAGVLERAVPPEEPPEIFGALPEDFPVDPPEDPRVARWASTGKASSATVATTAIRQSDVFRIRMLSFLRASCNAAELGKRQRQGQRKKRPHGVPRRKGPLAA